MHNDYLDPDPAGLFDEFEPSESEMNALQAAGIISDNCVEWDDVSALDQVRAVEWLQNRKGGES